MDIGALLSPVLGWLIDWYSRRRKFLAQIGTANFRVIGSSAPAVLFASKSVLLFITNQGRDSAAVGSYRLFRAENMWQWLWRTGTPVTELKRLTQENHFPSGWQTTGPLELRSDVPHREYLGQDQQAWSLVTDRMLICAIYDPTETKTTKVYVRRRPSSDDV